MASVIVQNTKEGVVALLGSLGLAPGDFTIVENTTTGSCEVFGDELLIKRLGAALAEH